MANKLKVFQIKVLTIFAVSFTLTACVGMEPSSASFVQEHAAVSKPAAQADSILLNFSEMTLSIKVANPQYFQVSVSGGVAEITPTTYEGIDGKRLVIESSDLKNLSALIRFEFGVLQYLTDNSPAAPLDFSHETNWTAVGISDNAIQIPQFYSNSETITDVYKQLGFLSNDELLSYLESKHFEKIKAISYREQKTFYTKLLHEDRKEFEQCCPEYIRQAKDFLTRSRGDFKSISDLGVEIYLRKLTLEISGFDRTGRQLGFTVIGKGAPSD